MNKLILRKQIRLFALIVIFSFLLPAIKIAGLGMKFDLIFLIPLLLSVIIVDSYVKKYFLFKSLFFIGLLIFFNMILSDSFGLINLQYINEIYFPREFVQVFSRISAFYVFFYIAFNNIIKYNEFIYYYNIIFIIALTFGILQSLDIGIIKNISNYYALTDTQLKGFESENHRGFGVAGNIITWGGVSCLMFYYFYYLSNNKLIKIIGCSFAVLNVTLSVGRSAIISLIVSFILVNLILAVFIKKNILSFLKILITLLLVFSSIFYLFITLFPKRYELILMRFSYMDEALNQSGRGAQREFFIKLMNQDYWNYMIGIGKPTLDNLGYMEMEPIFLIVAYGIIGLILHYLLMYFPLKLSFKLKLKNIKIFSFIYGVSICYLIFSLGFFFFREAYSGLLYWIIIGALLGYVIKLNKNEILS